MGEGVGDDESLMPYVSSANIACGYHAGSADDMRNVIRHALTYGVAIGAHPSFADRENFGRRELRLTAEEIYGLIAAQLQDINQVLREEGGILHHVKPHGALYNLSARDPLVALAIATAVRDFSSSLLIYGLSGSCSIDAALDARLPVAREAFADRRYRADGSLVPRSDERALIDSPGACVLQVTQLVTRGSVQCLEDTPVALKADTICIHGDNPGGPAIAKALADRLQTLGIRRRTVH